ncbi:MAG: adenosine kinase [Acidimicrobiales bacterium]
MHEADLSITDAHPDADGPGGWLDVVAVGSALVDVLTHTSGDVLERVGLAKGSMTLVDLSRAARVYREMGPATEVSGGSAANTAVGVAMLGGRAGYVGKVADDELGEVFVHDIRAAGVELGRLASTKVPGEPSSDRATGRCLVIVTEDGERTMATHLGVASTLGPEDLDEELVSRARVVYLEGYLWDVEVAKTAMRRAIEVAHTSDALVALTVSDPFCVRRHQREFLELLKSDVDVLFANEEEAVLLFGSPSFDAALSATQETGLLAAVTRGPAGSVVVGSGDPISVLAEPVERVIDTTGAGDLYAAGFLYGLTHGQDPERCARLGGLCAAEVISHIGARPEVDLRDLVP